MIGNVAASSPGGTAPPAPKGGKMGKEEFLKLFVAQMKNQDPLNPMQGQELAAQLAQFSSVEQLLNLNQQMESQAASQASVIQALQNSSAAGMLGRTVFAEGNLVNVPGDGTGSVTVEIGNTGGQGVLRILDLTGQEVGRVALGSLPGGRHTLSLGSAAAGLPAGAYAYAVDVMDGTGATVPVRTFSTGRVDGVRYDAGGAPILTSGPLRIPLGAVLELLPGS